MVKIKAFLLIYSLMFLVGCGTTWDNITAENYGRSSPYAVKDENIKALQNLINNPSVSYDTKLISHYSLAALYLGSISKDPSLNAGGLSGNSAVYGQQEPYYPEIVIEDMLFRNNVNRANAKEHLMIVSNGIGKVKGSTLNPEAEIKRRLSYTDYYLGKILKLDKEDKEALSYFEKFVANPYASSRARYFAQSEASSIRQSIAANEQMKMYQIAQKKSEEEALQKRKDEREAKEKEEARLSAIRATPEYKMQEAEKRIKYLNERIDKSFVEMEKEKKASLLSGYEDKEKLYMLGKYIVSAQEEQQEQWKTYKENGGQALSISEIK